MIEYETRIGLGSWRRIEEKLILSMVDLESLGKSQKEWNYWVCCESENMAQRFSENFGTYYIPRGSGFSLPLTTTIGFDVDRQISLADYTLV